MFIRLVLIIALSFFVIYGLNYFDIMALDYNLKTIAVTAVLLVLLRVLYSIFTKFLKVFLFVCVFLPLVGLLIYYLYAYATGTPIEMFDLDWIGNGTQWF